MLTHLRPSTASPQRRQVKFAEMPEALNPQAYKRPISPSSSSTSSTSSTNKSFIKSTHSSLATSRRPPAAPAPRPAPVSIRSLSASSQRERRIKPVQKPRLHAQITALNNVTRVSVPDTIQPLNLDIDEPEDMSLHAQECIEQMTKCCDKLIQASQMIFF